ncbi:hypothetical protein EBX93_16745 [bacterium]|nr:hypothetical protein [bacterium]
MTIPETNTRIQTTLETGTPTPMMIVKTTMNVAMAETAGTEGMDEMGAMAETAEMDEMERTVVVDHLDRQVHQDNAPIIGTTNTTVVRPVPLDLKAKLVRKVIKEIQGCKDPLEKLVLLDLWVQLES